MSTVYPEGSYMLWDGVNWNVLNAPPADSLISSDSGNVARLGSDLLVFVPADANDGRYLALTGGTMTGPLETQDPATDPQAANKRYVDQKVAQVSSQMVDEVYIGGIAPTDPNVELWYDTSV